MSTKSNASRCTTSTASRPLTTTVTWLPLLLQEPDRQPLVDVAILGQEDAQAGGWEAAFSGAGKMGAGLTEADEDRLQQFGLLDRFW